MTELNSRLDFDMAVRTWRKDHMSAGARNLGIWEHRITSGLQRLPYLKSIGRHTSDAFESPIELKVVLKEVASNLEAVRKDFRTVFSSYVVGNKKCQYVFATSAKGFDLHLTMLDDEDAVVVVLVHVEAS